MDWFRELKEEILEERPMCEICGDEPATQLHHALVKDMKRYHRILTVKINLMAVGEICHTSLQAKADNHEVKEAFAKKQVERGYDVGEWMRNLPLKIKEDWLLRMPRL